MNFADPLGWAAIDATTFLPRVRTPSKSPATPPGFIQLVGLTPNNILFVS